MNTKKNTTGKTNKRTAPTTTTGARRSSAAKKVLASSSRSNQSRSSEMKSGGRGPSAGQGQESKRGLGGRPDQRASLRTEDRNRYESSRSIGPRDERFGFAGGYGAQEDDIQRGGYSDHDSRYTRNQQRDEYVERYPERRTDSTRMSSRPDWPSDRSSGRERSYGESYPLEDERSGSRGNYSQFDEEDDSDRRFSANSNGREWGSQQHEEDEFGHEDDVRPSRDYASTRSQGGQQRPQQSRGQQQPRGTQRY